MIYDCFSFFNELDLLEIRLNGLKDVVNNPAVKGMMQAHLKKVLTVDQWLFGFA